MMLWSIILLVKSLIPNPSQIHLNMSTFDKHAKSRSVMPRMYGIPSSSMKKRTQVSRSSCVTKNWSVPGPMLSTYFTNTSKELSFTLDLKKIIKDIDLPTEGDSVARDLLEIMTKGKLPEISQVRRIQRNQNVGGVDLSKALNRNRTLIRISPMKIPAPQKINKRSGSEVKIRIRRRPTNPPLNLIK